MNVSGIRHLLLLSLIALTACQTAPVSPGDAGPAAEATALNQTPPDSCNCPPVEVVSAECPVQPAPPPPTSQPCQPPAAAKKTRPARGTQSLLIVGRVEYVLIKREGSANEPLKLKARVDTGSGLSSMHAHQLVEFERDGAPWVRFGVLRPDNNKPVFFERPVKEYASIKQATGDLQRRPVVRVSLTLGDIEESVEVSLTDRSDNVYPVLLGRNFLRDRAMVDVRRKFIADDGFYQD